MPISTICSENNTSRSFKHCLHVQNLPWPACQKDIKDLLKDLNVPESGILIQGTDAFVAVDNQSTLTTKSDHNILGHRVCLSLVDIQDVKDIFLRNARRRLSFDDLPRHCPNDLPNKSMAYITKRRKIRPTLVEKSRAFSCSVFSVEEVERECGERSLSCGSRRKIVPTSADDWSSWEKLSVFQTDDEDRTTTGVGSLVAV